MAFHYSPNIITDGLVLYLDAANTKSYISGSTTWNDISRGGNNGTLTNGPTFNGGNGGNIVFNGTDDFILGNDITSLFSNKLYASVVYRLTSSGNYPMVLNVGGSGGVGEGFTIRHNLSTGRPQLVLSSNGVTKTVEQTISVLNTLVQLGIYYDGSVIKLYKNGVYTGNSSAASGNIQFGTSPRYKVGARADGFYFGGRVYNVQIYNKALSDSEILQNFNALKSRFNI